MGDELVRLCDGIERHGLVDYQYGVWEEQITEGKYPHPLWKFGPGPLTLDHTVLLECCEQYNGADDGVPAASSSR